MKVKFINFNIINNDFFITKVKHKDIIIYLFFIKEPDAYSWEFVEFEMKANFNLKPYRRFDVEKSSYHPGFHLFNRDMIEDNLLAVPLLNELGFNHFDEIFDIAEEAFFFPQVQKELEDNGMPLDLFPH